MYLANLTWPAMSALDKSTPVVIPVAAVEQHGHHLPVYTDSLLLGEVVRRVELAMGERVLFAPLQWLGNSHHHLDFPGTISAGPRLYLDLLRELAENLLIHGFTRIVFLNGHGGNIVPGKQAVFELRQHHRSRTDLLLLFATYWEFSQPTGLEQHAMGHACEWETSMIQYLAPPLVVGDVTKLETMPFGFGFEPAYRGWTTNDRTLAGHIGSPQLATREKGEYLFNTFAEGVEGFLHQVTQWDGKRWA